MCITKKPAGRICHISALNGNDDAANFKFTNYSGFTYDDAQTVCKKIGGSVPVLKEEIDAVWLKVAIEFILPYVSSGWPFSMKWATWPVGHKKVNT